MSSDLITEEIETTVRFPEFRTRWEARQSQPAQLHSGSWRLAGWTLGLELSEPKSDGKVRLNLCRVSDNNCPLMVEDFRVRCLKTFSFGQTYMFKPRWLSWEDRPQTIRIGWGWDSFETAERLLAHADACHGTLAIEVKLRVARPAVCPDYSSCLRLPAAALLPIFTEPCPVTIRGDNGSEVLVPRAFLFAHSAVLKAALESGMMEGQTGAIDMPDAGQQTLEDLRDCLLSGGLPASMLTGWSRIADLLVLADKYEIWPLDAACSFYTTMAISRKNASRLLLLSAKYELHRLRRAVLSFAMSNDDNFEAVKNSDEYDELEAYHLREFWAFAAVRKTGAASQTIVPMNAQWGDLPREHPCGTDWATLSKDALRRACFERQLGTGGTFAELLFRLSNGHVDGQDPSERRSFGEGEGDHDSDQVTSPREAAERPQ